jgi:hypothetical protein
MLPALLVTLLLLQQQQPIPAPRLQVFLDCSECFADYLREETEFVDFVRDRTQATVHVIITNTRTASGGLEYVLAFIGQEGFTGQDTTLKAVTQTGDPEDVRRRQLLTTLHIGLLSYLARTGVPQGLQLDVEVPRTPQAAGARRDPWDFWVFSLRGSASFNGEESAKEREVSAEISADRITLEWKLTFGFDIEDQIQEFDLDEDEPVKTNRRERDFDSLIVKALGEHWSAGARGTIESSTFDNISLRMEVAPAVEFNVFPYSAYQRRQLRAQYAAGVRAQRYYEETLYGKTSEVLPAHEFSVTYDQREQWGSVESNIEWFQYLHDLSKSRLEANGEIAWRIVRGLSISADASASRIRDQISLRSRGATQEEILLRLRELQSGYEYDFSLSITYTFGSIFSSIVNPRFGQ